VTTLPVVVEPDPTPDPVPDTDPEPEPQASPSVTVTAWIQQRPRAVIVTLAVLAVPYLIICSGLAVLLASGLVGGTCGG